MLSLERNTANLGVKMTFSSHNIFNDTVVIK